MLCPVTPGRGQALAHITTPCTVRNPHHKLHAHLASRLTTPSGPLFGHTGEQEEPENRRGNTTTATDGPAHRRTACDEGEPSIAAPEAGAQMGPICIQADITPDASCSTRVQVTVPVTYARYRDEDNVAGVYSDSKAIVHF